MSEKPRENGSGKGRAGSSLVALPIAIFFAIAVAVVALWSQLERREDELLEGQTRIAAAQLRLRLEAWFDERARVAERLAEDWENQYQREPRAFAREAERIIELLEGYQAINWIDAEGRIRTVSPSKGNQPALGKNIYDHPDPRVAEAVRRAAASGKPSRTPAVELFQGGMGFALYQPVISSTGEVAGFVNVVFKIEEALALALSDLRLGDRFEVRVRIGGKPDDPTYLIADTPVLIEPDAGGLRPFEEVISIRVVDEPWTLSVAPSESFVAQTRTGKDGALLFTGLLLAAAVSFLFHDSMKRQFKLRASESRFRMLAEAIPVPIGITRVTDGKILYGNEKLRETFGLDPDDPTDRYAKEFVAEPESMRRVLQGLDRDGYIENQEIQFKSHNGARPWFSISMRKIRFDGEDALVAGYVDISALKSAHTALQVSEKNYRNLFTHANDAIFVFDYRTLKILDANAKAGELLAYAQLDLIGKPLNDIYPLKRSRRRREHLKNLGVRGSLVFEDEVLRSNGNFIPVEISARRVEYEGRLAVQCFVRDIAARKEAEQALKASEENHRTLIEAASEGIMVLHRDGTVVLANPQAASVLDSTPERIVGQSVDSLWTKSVAAEWMAHIGRAIETGSGFTTEIVQPSSEGDRYFTTSVQPLRNAEGVFDRVMTISTDVTESKLAETALRESEVRYRELSDNLPQTVFEADLAGRLTFINSRGFTRFGYTREAFDAGLNVFDMIAPADRARALEEMKDTLSGSMKSGVEFNAQRQNGETFPAIVHARPIVRDGQAVGIRGILTDVSQSRHAEEEQERLKDQLRQSQKLEAIGTLAGGVAHDFNNLLTGILGYANMLKVGSEPGSDVYRGTEVIERAAERASELTHQLLGFARKGKMRNTDVDVHLVINEVITLLDRTIDKSIVIQTQLRAEKHFIRGDATQIQQIILNLAVNARDAMKDGGNLTFHSDTVDFNSESTRRLSGLQPGTYLLLQVSDTGAGIPKELQDRIFEPFFTTKDQGEGTGMGLATVYGIVKNHDGLVRVSSEEGKGTTFKIFLPVQEPSPKKDSPEKEVKPLRKGRGRVMVVDDEEVVRKLAQDMLEQLGYEVVTLENGEEAVNYYSKHSETIDVAIIDMIMPKLGGRDCFRALKEINPGVRAILSSGYSQEGAVQEILDQGMRGFVQKPYKMEELSDAVARALDDLVDSAVRPEDG